MAKERSGVKSHPAVIAIGLKKGHPITKFKLSEKKAKKCRPSVRKGVSGKRTKFIRQVINEVSGVASYEKRAIEFLKAGSVKDSKRALKVCKKALGTHRRAKGKRENLIALLRVQAKAKAKDQK